MARLRGLRSRLGWIGSTTAAILIFGAGALSAGRRHCSASHGVCIAGRADPYNPPKAKQLLADAGYPQGIDAGLFAAIPGFPTIADAVVNDLNAAGIRLKQIERAAFYADWQAKKLRGLFMTASGNSGNAASRVDSFIQSKGAYAYGGYPDIDELFQQQAGERDPKKREALLDKIQQLTIDRAMGTAPRFTRASRDCVAGFAMTNSYGA